VNETVDVVISNCVINLAPDKRKVYNEIYRVLKAGGHFCISDIVSKGNLPEGLKRSAELYTGCLAGASDIKDIKEIIRGLGFKNFQINSEKQVVLDHRLLEEFLDMSELKQFKENAIGIYSMTISAYK
jgi:arsenite methyltransferase